MALSQAELNILFYHGNNNYLVNILKPDYLAISNFYNSIPPGDLNSLVKLLSPYDRNKFFDFTDFPCWYSSLCLKIHNDTTIKVFGMTNNDINYYSLKLLNALIEYGLTEHSMQQLIQHIFKRQLSETLDALLRCLGANGDFLEYTLYLLNVDMTPLPRWQTLGISEPPTELECQSIF